MVQVDKCLFFRRTEKVIHMKALSVYPEPVIEIFMGDMHKAVSREIFGTAKSKLLYQEKTFGQ